jgi:hypothetical protein
MTDFSALPPRERAKRYRQIAAAMRRDAERATPEARAPYLVLAEQWDKLAEEAEAATRKPAPK